jgi:hypothetical protein
MAQIGILFDTQKLGSGFYGYTAFRILFSVLPPRELTGCLLYHGEVGDGRSRPYCIAVESDDDALLVRVRQSFTRSMARGLLPLPARFLDEAALQEEVLALAARVGVSGEMTDCQSRWVQEAWQRAQGQSALAAPEQVQMTAKPPESRPQAKLPNRVPYALRWSPAGQRAIAFLAAFSVGGALLPWMGWPLAICATVFIAGLIHGTQLRMRLWAQESLSGDEMLAEALKLLSSKPLHEVCDKLQSPGPQSSPLLRRVLATCRVTASSPDLGVACHLAGQQALAEEESLVADVREIHLFAWGCSATVVLSLAVYWTFLGPAAALSLAPRLLLFGLSTCAPLHAMAVLLRLSGMRFEAQVRMRIALKWLPALRKVLSVPKTQTDSLEQALSRLSEEMHAMRASLDMRRDKDFVETLAELRASVDELIPVLAGFREPFVLQAVPASGRPKAVGATA